MHYNLNDIHTFTVSLLFLLLFIITITISAHQALAEQYGTYPPQNLTNVALGKKYVVFPQPNYSLCTDPNDALQLTDGVYTKTNIFTSFWREKSTVGWTRQLPVTITVDLGTVVPICGIAFNTASGTFAGVHWPSSIQVFFSNDGESYFLGGDLVQLDAKHSTPPTDQYGIHRYWTVNLSSYGRYVTFLVVSNGSYIFTDEIEIYRGDDSILNRPIREEEIGDPLTFFKERNIAAAVRHRISSDLTIVQEMSREAKNSKEFDTFFLRRKADIDTIQRIPIKGFRCEFPLNDMHEDVFSAQSSIWRKKGLKGTILWQKNRWDMIDHLKTPTANGAQVNIEMMRNEFRSEAFCISNADSINKTLFVVFQGLPGGNFPDYLTVHCAPFTDTKNGPPVIAALPKAKKPPNGYEFHIPSGLTKQFWLTIHSKNLPAGTHSGKIIIKPDNLIVPITIKVHPLIFPTQPSLHFGGWDYTNERHDRGVTPHNKTALINHLREHYVNTPWATISALALGKYDSTGTMIVQPDTSNFKDWLDHWPEAKKYFIYASVHGSFGGFKAGTTEFRKAVSEWITFWTNKLKTWKIQPTQIGILPLDEVDNIEDSKVFAEFAQIIKAVQPEVIIFNDASWTKPWKAPPELFTSSDILCPHFPTWIKEGEQYQNFYLKQQKKGKKLWFYSAVGPASLLDPYYYRMLPWFCWKYNAEGFFIWSFGDVNGSSSWNEYSTKTTGSFTPFFLDETSVTPGIKMEAIREGIEDYEYLKMLKDRIAQLEKSGEKSAALTDAKRILSTAADKVTSVITSENDLQWKKPKDRGVMDSIRLEILFTLKTLQNY